MDGIFSYDEKVKVSAFQQSQIWIACFVILFAIDIIPWYFAGFFIGMIFCNYSIFYVDWAGAKTSYIGCSECAHLKRLCRGCTGRGKYLSLNTEAHNEGITLFFGIVIALIVGVSRTIFKNV